MAVERLLRFVKAERLTLITVDPTIGVRQVSHPFDPAGVIEFAQNYADKDLRIQRVLFEGRRGVMATQDLMTPEEIARCPVHNEYYRHFPECWNTLVAAGEGEGVIHSATFQRSAQYGLFNPEERRSVELLSQHILRVAHLRDLLSPSTITSEGVLAALDGLTDGLLVFDEAGQVVHMNAAAKAIVDTKDGLELHNGVPVALHPQSRDLLCRMITTILRAAAGEPIDLHAPISLPRPGKSRPLRVRGFVSPHVDGPRRIGLLTLQAEHEWRLPTVEAIQAATGLTPAESRVVLALLQEIPLREYADRSGLSEHTVRFQMKRVREKLGVNRQAAVVSTVLRLCRLE